jgi:hypothetical protein
MSVGTMSTNKLNVVYINEVIWVQEENITVTVV